MTPPDEAASEVDRGESPGSPNEGRGSLFPWIAGVVSLILVGGTSLAVVIVNVASAPAEGRVPRETPPSESPPVPADPPAADRENGEIRTLWERKADLELEVMRLRSRIKEMDAATVERLAERVLTGDPESVKGARRILESRGGILG
ncbi:MAG: hypothetical protein ACYS47_17630, partial [Planctomycetota bacterium]